MKNENPIQITLEQVKASLKPVRVGYLILALRDQYDGAVLVASKGSLGQVEYVPENWTPHGFGEPPTVYWEQSGRLNCALYNEDFVILKGEEGLSAEKAAELRAMHNYGKVGAA